MGEIETVLRRGPGVRAAVVLLRDEDPARVSGEKRLVACLELEEEPSSIENKAVSDELRPLDEDQSRALHRFLADRLPDYMTPTLFTVLDRLPMLPSGKVDRVALARTPLPVSGFSSEAETAPPRTPTEEIIAAIWAEVLGLDRVGIHQGFFDMGGHSLTAARTISRIREVFALDLPLRALFEASTVAGLSKAVEAARLGAARDELPPILPVQRDQAIPVSHAQHRLWFMDQMEGGAVYHIDAAARIRGRLRHVFLERALTEIRRRHPSLRTTFTTREGVPFQEIQPESDLAMPLVDLSGLPEPQRAALLLQLARREALRPFDLGVGPLFRATLIHLSADDHLLMATMHHIISDGWSVEILFRELALLYGGLALGKPVRLPTLAISYADFAQWQRTLPAAVFDKQLGYWQERLAGAPNLLELPTDRVRPVVQSFKGGVETFELDRELVRASRALARKTGATPFMCLEAVFAALLFRYSGQRDILVGAPVANRTRPETEPVIGFLSILWSCETISRETPAFSSFCNGSVRSYWMLTITRISLSNAWWKRCDRNGIPVTTPCSRRCFSFATIP